MAYYPSGADSISSNPDNGIGTPSAPNPGYGFPTGISDPPNIYAGTSAGDIIKIDPVTLSMLDAVQITTNPIYGITWDGTNLYAMEGSVGTSAQPLNAYVLDPNTLKILDTLNLNPSNQDVFMYPSLFSWFNNFIYATTQL